jgi:hypothetical protein
MADRWFSPGSSTNKTDCHDIAEILFRVALNTRVHLSWAEFELTTLMVICTGCTESCKFNSHMMTTTMTPVHVELTILIQYSLSCKATYSAMKYNDLKREVVFLAI